MSNRTKTYMLITLGEELLLGLTRNGHLTYIGNQLRQRGITLHSNYTISDDNQDIDQQFAFCWERSDVLITTGGLGPTVDDRTKEAIADALGESLVFDESILESMEERFRQIGKPMSDNNRKQAYRPQSAIALENPNGTAPGLWLEKSGKILIMLPGPPNELQPMFENQVVPRLEKLGLIDQGESYLQIRSIGIGESALETELQPLFDQHEQLAVAYCAHQGQVDCRISFPDSTGREKELHQIGEECRRLLGADFLGYGHDSLPEIVLNSLKYHNVSLALAESFTGGQIANAITDIPGASSVFNGSIVCYSDEVKINVLGVPKEIIRKNTAVSEPVAEAMALGAAKRLNSDYAISATGYAGPDWDIKDLKWAIDQAQDGKISVLCFHGVPALEH
ncbi:MAG: CinA family nicotinamide mononucleotide deamidase-related protein, partial [Opitutales bacterium]|nr:CinA family nicotinamide mononucleotide deamidase-related protein [Opitutales bacterium]